MQDPPPPLEGVGGWCLCSAQIFGGGRGVVLFRIHFQIGYWLRLVSGVEPFVIGYSLLTSLFIIRYSYFINISLSTGSNCFAISACCATSGCPPQPLGCTSGKK